MWNDDWRTELEENNYGCYIRLCECRSLKADIICITKIMHKYNPSKDINDCLDRTIEWICDWNGQYYLADDLTMDEYENMIKKKEKMLDI